MKKKKGNNLLLYIAIIAVVGFGAAFAYQAYLYYIWWSDGQSAQENTAIVQDIFEEQLQIVSELISEESEENDEPNPLLNFTALLNEVRELTGNPDIVAYIHISDTNVSNAVLQGHDNSYYLNRDMFGNFNSNGSIFLDYLNSSDFSDPNTVIYGHNMNNGTMFHNLRYYIRDRQFFEDNSIIKIITDYEVLIYEIFSVFSTRIDFNYIQVEFDSPEEFEYLIREFNRRSIFSTDINPTVDDRILTLSTCTNVDNDTRIVVVSKLVERLY